jgi:hypothetical protein
MPNRNRGDRCIAQSLNQKIPARSAPQDDCKAEYQDSTTAINVSPKSLRLLLSRYCAVPSASASGAKRNTKIEASARASALASKMALGSSDSGGRWRSIDSERLTDVCRIATRMARDDAAARRPAGWRDGPHLGHDAAGSARNSCPAASADHQAPGAQGGALACRRRVSA